MIKRMETESIKIERADETTVFINIGDDEKTVILTVDQLKELILVGECFFNVNNLEHYTESSIKQREEWAIEARTPYGMLRGSTLESQQPE